MTGRRAPAATAASPRRAVRKVPGEPGVWVFILGDLLLFAFLFAAYLQNRIGSPQLFAASQQALDTGIGAINTLVLLTSSLFVVLALAANRNGSRKAAPRLTGVAIVLGLGFVTLKAVEYHDTLINGLNPGTNDFFLWYFILTAIHLGHVLIGLGLLAYVLTVMRRRVELVPGTVNLVEGSACFWHMVDLLWIVLFPLLYLVA